jgi:hypothetical protein
MIRFLALLGVTFLAWSSALADQKYIEIQDETIKNIENFYGMITTDGAKPTAVNFPDTNLYYLNGVLLFCSVKNGSCPFLLDTILEIDVFNSQLDNKVSCPHMLRFWQEWIDNSFEQRLSYSLGTGVLKKYQDFKTQERPRYLKCSNTVQNLVVPGASIDEFMKTRYELQTPIIAAFKKTMAYLRAIREEIDDVFVAAGAYKHPSKPKPVQR